MKRIFAAGPKDALERKLFYWSLLAALFVLGALALPFWLGRIYLLDDLGAFHLPTRAFYSEQLAAGRSFDWLPELYGGFYLSGEGQLGGQHPLHRLLYGALPLRGAYCLELLLSYPALLAGTFLFLRRRTGRNDAAMYGAIVFAFSGFALLHFAHVNAVAVLAHLPWLLLAIDHLYSAYGRRRRSLAAIAIAVLTGSQMLLGYPQFVWLSLVTEMAFVGYLTRYEAASAQDLAYYIAGKAVGLLIGAAQTLPTLDALAHSVRTGITHDALVEGSLHPWNLFQLWGPYLFEKRVVGQNTHELAMYVGAAPLLLIVWLCARRGKSLFGQPFLMAMFVLGGAALLLAMGRWAGVYELQTMLPVVGKFRFPSRYVALFSLAVAALAAVAIVELVTNCPDRSRANRRASLALVTMAGASVVSVLLAPALFGAEHLGSPLEVWAGPALVSLAAALIWLAQRGHRLAIVGLALLTAVDLGVYGLSYSVYQHGATSQYVAIEHGPPAGEPGRVLIDFPAARSTRPQTGNELLLAGWGRFDGYSGLAPARELDYRSLAALRLAGVRWVAASVEAEKIPGLVRRDNDWFEVPAPLPKVRLVGDAIATRDPQPLLAEIDIATQALTERPLPMLREGAGQIDSVNETPGLIEAQTTTDQPQLLVVAESFHSGWQATVGTKRTAVERVNGDFIGCVVPAGTQRVVFEFKPASLRLGRVLSLLGVLVVCVWTATLRKAP